jgi:hypothetical protein
MLQQKIASFPNTLRICVILSDERQCFERKHRGVREADSPKSKNLNIAPLHAGPLGLTKIRTMIRPVSACHANTGYLPLQPVCEARGSDTKQSAKVVRLKKVDLLYVFSAIPRVYFRKL